MAESQLREMISAFAAGCMDRENFIQFREYIASGGSLPQKELGELQNTMALVPIILELEKPDIELKKKVASKLLSLQDEIKAKIKEQKQKLAEAGKTEEDIDFPDFEPTFTTREIESLQTIEKRKTSGSRETEEGRRTGESHRTGERRRTSSQPESVSSRTGAAMSDESAPKPKFSKLTIYSMSAAVVLFILLIITYFTLSFSNSEVEEQLAKKDKVITSLQKQLAEAKLTSSEYKELLQFLKNKDNYIVELTGGEQNPSALGRLIISFRIGDGILILENPPRLKEDEAMQAWIVTKGKSISLGTLTKENSRKYYFIYNIPKLPLNEIELFRITNEPKAGSVIPLGNTLLYGNIPKF